MLSLPPVMTMHESPARLDWAAWLMAARPEAHTFFSVGAMADVGMPAAIDAWRAGAWPAPDWITWPMITSSMPCGSTAVRSIAALMATAPSCVAGMVAMLPIILPMGGQAAAMM